jgi:hypothetical protein
VSARELRRLFWRGAAALLVVAALVALSALLGGDFDETDGEILATLGVVLLAGGVFLAGLGLRDQQKAGPVAIAILVAAPLCSLALLVDIWRGFEGDDTGRWAGTALMVLVACGVLGSNLLTYRNPALAWLMWGEAVALTGALASTLWLIWIHDPGDGSAKLAAACWILAVLGWVLVPVLQRSTASAPDQRGAERVLATLADVDLVVTLHPQQGDLVVRGVSQLYPGEQVALRRRQTASGAVAR